jgi:uncharacterized membrane protein
MADTPLPSWFGPFAARPRLVGSAVGGAVVALAARYIVGLQPSTALILGWDALSLTYIGIMFWRMRGCTPDLMRAEAAQTDEGRATILTLVITAAAIASVAIGLELSLAKGAHGAERLLRIALAFGTLAASWVMVHLIFAQHYAHAYYDRDVDGIGDTRGLRFPGDEEPDYWDFLHFAMIVGVASQTADIAISAKPLRRLNTVHALFSFTFNTVIVALTINLLAGVFS